jgi:hypothetical protein
MSRQGLQFPEKDFYLQYVAAVKINILPKRRWLACDYLRIPNHELQNLVAGFLQLYTTHPTFSIDCKELS